MKLHFITSISQEYWETTAKKCIKTWNLPGQVTIYIDQQFGDLNWLDEVPFNKRLLHVPPLEVDNFTNTAKVRKFWGKACAQIVAVRNREMDERIIWLDGDIEQISHVPEEVFSFDFTEPFSTMNSHDGDDCWESGVVIFNQQNGKLNQAMKHYERSWNNQEVLASLWKPYDAQVLGYTATEKGYLNLCETQTKNEFALAQTRYRHCLKHWINKENKRILQNNV